MSNSIRFWSQTYFDMNMFFRIWKTGCVKMVESVKFQKFWNRSKSKMKASLCRMISVWNSYFDVNIFSKSWKSDLSKIVKICQNLENFKIYNVSFSVSNDIGFWSRTITLMKTSFWKLKNRICEELLNFVKIQNLKHRLKS